MTLPARASGRDPEAPATGRTGVVLRDPLPWHDMVEIVQAAEDTGYEAVFVPEIAGREAFSTLTGFALATSTISLGTGVVTIPSRSPVATAMGAATVHDLSGGRMILGIGTGAVRDVARMSRGSVLELTGRYTETVKRALSGQDVQPDETVGAPRFRLALRLTTGPPPVWLGALGDGMIRLAGRVADGVLLNWCTPERVADAKRRLAEGAAQVGRDPAELTVAVYVRACLGVEEPIALEALREMTGLYASFRPYRKQFELMGLGREASAAATAFDAGRPRDVPETIVRALTVLGGRNEALSRFAAYHEAGADLVLCYPVAALEPMSSVLGTVLAAAPSPALER